MGEFFRSDFDVHEAKITPKEGHGICLVDFNFFQSFFKSTF